MSFFDRGCPHCHSIYLGTNGLTLNALTARECKGIEGATQTFTCGCTLILQNDSWIETSPCIPEEGWHEPPVCICTDVEQYSCHKYGTIYRGTLRQESCKWHFKHQEFDTFEQALNAAKTAKSSR